MKIFKKNSKGSASASRRRDGFTLIELLVVIAIIGILSSVVLTSLNSARTKAADVGIKANLDNVRLQAEIQYDSLGCYANSGLCTATLLPAFGAAATLCSAATSPNIFSQANIAASIDSARLAGGSFASCASTAAGAAWAVAVNLKSDSTKAWCVDSNGMAKEYTGVGTQALLYGKVTGGACSAT